MDKRFPIGAAAIAAVALLTCASPAFAHGGGVQWSVTVGTPFYAAPPVAAMPPPVVVYPQPQFIYGPPPSIYAPPPVIYVQPAPVYRQAWPLREYHGHGWRNHDGRQWHGGHGGHDGHGHHGDGRGRGFR